MASDFILQIICRIHQIRNPKRPLFRVKSQKNDTIGSATLIAPEITSGIKPGMYGSLFNAHDGRYLSWCGKPQPGGGMHPPKPRG